MRSDKAHLLSSTPLNVSWRFALLVQAPSNQKTSQGRSCANNVWVLRRFRLSHNQNLIQLLHLITSQACAQHSMSVYRQQRLDDPNVFEPLICILWTKTIKPDQRITSICDAFHSLKKNLGLSSDNKTMRSIMTKPKNWISSEKKNHETQTQIDYFE